MKRDILDDYRDFLMAVKDKVLFQVIPIIARIDEDGDVKQDFLIKMIIPGVGVAQGAAVAWVKPDLFHHGDYDEPCDTEMIFHELRIPDLDGDNGQIVEEFVDGEWRLVHVPPDPGLEDIDDNLNSWFNGLGL